MYKENDIVTFKLVTGEEIVTRMVKDNDSTVTIYKPLTLMHSSQGMALVQTVMSVPTDQDLNIQKSSIVLSGLTREEIRNAWYESTTGLKTASKSSILMG